MEIVWYGQSAFLLRAGTTVAVDPFADVRARAAERGLRFGYTPVGPVDADLLLITHEHFDHNGAEAIGGTPQVIRSTAGRFETPVGEVVAIASEHDPVAGTQRGPNTIFRFDLDGFSVCHFGDFGQSALRAEQREAIGDVDILLLPVGAGPTVGGEDAAAIVRTLRPRLVVPMHYRTDAIDFLDPPDAFLEALAWPMERLKSSEVDVTALLQGRSEPIVALPRAACLPAG
jgi:L-ascorbate metabolism protein UlaG (beta-lactamase superfamily)